MKPIKTTLYIIALFFLCLIIVKLFVIAPDVIGEEYISDADRQEIQLNAKMDEYLKSMTVHYSWDGDETDYATGTWAVMSARVN